MDFKKYLTPPIINVLLISLISLVEGLQLLMLLAVGTSFIPCDASFSAELLSEAQGALKPEWDSVLYRFFVIGVMALQAAILFSLRRKLDHVSVTRFCARFLAWETLLVFLLGFIIFKYWAYRRTEEIRMLFYFVLGAGILLKVFWVGFFRRPWKALEGVSQIFNSKKARGCFDVAVVVFIFLTLYVPDISGVLGRIFTDDYFYHFDSFAAAPGWGVWTGGVPQQTFYSQYGAGYPYLITGLCRVLRGFDYGNVLVGLCFLTIIYYVAMYVFLRCWLRVPLLAFAGVLWAMKFLLFYFQGIYHFVWAAPSGSPVRFLWDILFFFLVWAGLQRRQLRWFILALVVSGAAVFYITDTGAYLMATGYCLLFLLWMSPTAKAWAVRGRKGWPCYPVLFLIPIATLLVLLWSLYGAKLPLILGTFDTVEYIRIVQSGLDAIPFFSGIKTRWYYDTAMALAVALLFLFTVIFVTAMVIFRKLDERHLLGALVSIYGLLFYQYFVFRSSPVSYRIVSTPLVLVACYWVAQGCLLFSQHKRRGVYAGVALVSVFCLFTTHTFLTYPNLFNPIKYPESRIKREFREDLAISDDVNLIKGLTGPREKVPLLSSFEVLLLMQADRGPFFYYFPLMSSDEFQKPKSRGTKIATHDQVQRIIDQLEGDKPLYVFIEKRVFDGSVSPEFYEKFTALNTFNYYLYAHYQVYQQGKFLLALRRKDAPPP